MILKVIISYQILNIHSTSGQSGYIGQIGPHSNDINILKWCEADPHNLHPRYDFKNNLSHLNTPEWFRSYVEKRVKDIGVYWDEHDNEAIPFRDTEKEKGLHVVTLYLDPFHKLNDSNVLISIQKILKREVMFKDILS
jgi:hypothetical protein